MINLCFQLNGKKYKVLAVEDNSTNIMDQIYLLSTPDNVKLKIKVDNKTYTVLANEVRSAGRIFYIKTGTEDKFSVSYSNVESTIAFKANDKIFYGISDIYVENYYKFIFIDGERPTNQITKFYKKGQRVDVFLETTEFFDAYPEKGIAYWTIDEFENFGKISPIDGSLIVGSSRAVDNPTVILRSTYMYLNKPLDSIEILGTIVRNQVTSTSRIRDVITGSSGGGSTGGGT